MKKLILAAIALFFVSTAFAQINFGIKGGYNSSLTLADLGGITSGTYNLNSVKGELANGFHGGIFGRIFFDKVYFQPELLYAMQKKDYQITLQDVSNNDVTIDKFVTLSTVDIPLLIGYKVLDLKVANIRAFAGPQIRFNAGSQVNFENIGNFDPNQFVNDFKESQIGLQVGAGVDVLMLALDFKYNLVGDIYQPKWQINPTSTSTFVISLGWKIF
jgi:hypothetical protein